MSILLGSEYKYNKEFCKPLKYRRTIPLSKILKQIKKELEKLNISVLRPNKKKDALLYIFMDARFLH